MGTRRNYQRTSNKNDSPLHVLPVAEKLIDYTLDLTDNAKRFPKRVRFFDHKQDSGPRHGHI